MAERAEYWLYCLKHPHYATGRAVRKYRAKLLGLGYLGKNVDVRFPLHLGHPENISIGDNTVICEYAFLIAGPNSRIEIGANTYLAPNVYITTTAHRFRTRDRLIMEQGSTEEDVSIGSDVLLGRGVTVLPGVDIGEGAIVGAGSVVVKDITPYYIAQGVPARMIRARWQ